MTAVGCLSNIINDCHALSNETLNNQEVVDRWLGWINSVNKPDSGLPEAELHTAFMFTCDSCGRDCFVRGIEMPVDDDDDDDVAAFVVPATKIVKCEHCKAEYKARIVHPYDDDEDDDD